MRNTLIAALVLIGCAAQAQGFRGGERQQDRRELAQDRKEGHDDKRDQEELRRLESRFEDARRSRDMRSIHGVDMDLIRLLDREIQEGQRELAQDVHEVKRDNKEIRQDRFDSRSEKRDDAKDRRDDVRDAMVEHKSLQRVRAIRQEVSSFNGRTDGVSLMRRGEIFRELLSLAHQEVRQNVQEKKEDRREAHEDRH